MVNSVYFNKKQFENGEMDNFIHQLAAMSYGKGDNKIQILITPEDCESYSVQFIQTPWSGEYGGSFEFVDEDQSILTEKVFPDNHIELCYSEDEYKERLDEWFKENPGWTKTSYGTWTNEIDNKKLYKELMENGNVDLEEESAPDKAKSL